MPLDPYPPAAPPTPAAPPAPAPPPPPTAAELATQNAALQDRVAALEARLAPQPEKNLSQVLIEQGVNLGVARATGNSATDMRQSFGLGRK